MRAWEVLDSMSGSVTNDSESGETRRVKFRYVIGQCDNFNAAVDAVKAYAPDYAEAGVSGAYWVRKQLDVTCIGNKYFDCVAQYETMLMRGGDNPMGGGQVGVLNFGISGTSWDTTGNTEHITKAYKERRYGVDAVDFQKAINVSGDSVNGVDAVRPGMRYTETWVVPVATAFDEDFVGKIHRLTGTVNKDQFRCFEPGEALFLGARGQYDGDQPFVEITFDFECRPNVEVDLSGDNPKLATVIFDKKGWEYMWFLYEPIVEDDQLVQRPCACYVNEIYKEESWDGLGIVSYTYAEKSPQDRSDPEPPSGGWF